MALGVGERERFGGRRDQADEALARAHGGQMHRFAVEALGCEQFERTVGARDIERADLGDHVGGDQNNDAVQARLRRDRLRHDLAEPSQQQSRSARRAHHKGPCPTFKAIRPLPGARVRKVASDGPSSAV